MSHCFHCASLALHLITMGCFKSLFHTLVAGVGFLSDAYDLFVVNTVVVILAKVYPAEDVHGESAVATAAVLGSVFGQVWSSYTCARAC